MSTFKNMNVEQFITSIANDDNHIIYGTGLTDLTISDDSTGIRARYGRSYPREYLVIHRLGIMYTYSSFSVSLKYENNKTGEDFLYPSTNAEKDVEFNFNLQHPNHSTVFRDTILACFKVLEIKCQQHVTMYHS